MLLNPSAPSAALSAALPSARAVVQSLGASRIREVANAGIGMQGVLPFWFGEPDQQTPEFIRDAAKQALDAGDTFYTHNFGIAPLREAIANYVSALHRPVEPGRVAVTSSGVSALMLLSQLIVNPGDRVVAVTPLWPNLVEIPKILGAEVVKVPLRFGQTWELDVQQLLDALTPGTRAVLLNSPNNPTGWVITREQQEIILAHCRRHGIWILADDVYERLVYDTPGAPDMRACAPSFLDLAHPDDRIVSANSFSKSWLMTGWRLGWVIAPEPMMADLGKLIEYNTSCAPGFAQRGGIVAVERGEEIIAHTVERYRAARDFLHARLNAMPGISAPKSKGAMYLFFRVDGAGDTLDLCKRLVVEARLGLAPGSAFGPEGEGYIRWCFASSLDRLEDGAQRLEKFLRR
ncbi:pyridoxal phosphate-dependent aminotransferase [Noviherbaspirillum sp. CPCC 100848]|uniref:Aminotransferase n=1 Tax=Noviherbaspirillum album TaxID=3080276 RepID=A0ABU6J656_9BURK|nr:pyridoxal phosphate-dependent aminotransferase [Noviherbaspirillum sp. CPCC 100848]MEC4718825.1 pyridoxal phosphate-dependent aminotransferase [Noviherbaspirillum sp. CPCC 100848]